nr:MAG TPA: hypothetical protein [Caudoviricetes sp.]
MISSQNRIVSRRSAFCWALFCCLDKLLCSFLVKVLINLTSYILY